MSVRSGKKSDTNKQSSSNKSADEYIDDAFESIDSTARVVVSKCTSDELSVVTSSSDTNLDLRKEDLVHTPSIQSFIPKAGFGWLAQWKAQKLASSKYIEAATVIYNSAIQKLEIEAEASVRESKNFWKGKSAEVCEAIQTYVRATLAALEKERMIRKVDVLQQTYEHADMKIKEIASSDIAEKIKTQLIRNVVIVMNTTIADIMSDALSKKYMDK